MYGKSDEYPMKAVGQALLDGTGDEELHALLFETPVTMLSAMVEPPPTPATSRCARASAMAKRA